MTTLTITAKGQVTLRKDVLQHLGVGQGDQIEVSKLPGGRVEVRAVRAAGTIDSFIGMLSGKVRKVATIEQMNDAAAKGWAGRK
jgi:AbrB family looped-hinge helix DNA binding protein